jgi:ATP-binding cassette subfamily F protein 3
MSAIDIRGLSQSFGAFDIFTGISASISHDDRIGIVGPNGIGKTSLLHIIGGLAQPTGGSVTVARGMRIGYLHQEAARAFGDTGQTVMQAMLALFDPLRHMEARMRELEMLMGIASDLDPILDEYGELQTQFETGGGYDYELRIERTLAGLGLTEHSETPIALLSGGQKTRALLARLLLEGPDVLILDEPTNHLDIDAVTWLEHALYQWDKALLVVSHDRYFLDQIVRTIWEMREDGLDVYRGNYSAYLDQREARWERYATIFETEKARLYTELDYVKRNIARASTNGMAVGRLRIISRDIQAIEQVGIVAFHERKSWSSLGISTEASVLDIPTCEQRLKAIKPRRSQPHRIHARLSSGPRSSEVVLSTNGLCAGYPDNPLLLTGAFKLYRGETAALIGPNGAGKTTLLRTIMRQIPPLDGNLSMGDGVRIGHFSQTHDRLNGPRTVLDETLSHHAMRTSEARNHLARYVFTGDDVFKPLQALSGGERGRLALALLALEQANFLLLDEPTNHLDIPAQETLQAILEAFDGTILLVSHDRYLIDRLATRIWALEGGELHVHNGPYREYEPDGDAVLA